MTFFVFPFDKIPQNSKVVLYAAGIAGNHYYNQLKQTNYCEVVLWVDKYVRSENVKAPETIKELKSTDYDFVVISTSVGAIVAEAKELLENKYGIPGNKIIHECYCYRASAGRHSSLTLNEFLHDKKATTEALVKYFYESEGDIDFFNPLIQEIKSAFCENNEEENQNLKEDILSNALNFLNEVDLTAEAKVVLIYIIFQTEIFSKDLLRVFVNLISQINDNLPLKYWLISDCSFIWFAYPGLLYDDFFVELKNLRCDYARELCLTFNPPVYVKGNNLNICILMLFNSPNFLNITSLVSHSLSSRGYRIHLIDLNVFCDDAGSGIVKPLIRYNRLLNVSKEDIEKFYPGDTKYYCPQNTTMKNRQQDILDLICGINPICILDFADEYSSTSFYYYQSYPTIHFPLRSHGIASSTFFHKYVMPTGKGSVVVHESIKREQVLELPMMIKFIKPLRKFSREEYELTKEDVVVITVGNQLHFEISDELINQMCDLINFDKKVKWLIVGCNNLPYVKKNYFDLINKYIFFIEYEHDLTGLYGICDIYLNPNRVGGGLSVAWAMQHGLAIVATVGGDAEICYLKKTNCMPTKKDLIPFIEELSKNHELLRQRKALSLEIAEEWSNVKFANKLIEAINELANNF